MIELLVSLAIIGILLAIIIPAVQSARETARRTECVNNLRQIGLAILSFENTHGHFPNSNGLSREKIGNWVVDVLPFMEQQSFCDEIVRIQGDFDKRGGDSRWPEIRKKLLQLSPPGFHCPSDSLDLPGGMSYPGNSGIWRPLYGENGIFREQDDSGPTFGPSGPVRTGEITDGLSNTMMASEWLRGNPNGVNEADVAGWDEPRRFTWYLPINMGAGADIQTLIHECSQVPPTNPRLFHWNADAGGLGVPWFYGTVGYSTYNHAMTPNTASCRPWVSSLGLRSGAYTTGSMHRNGVNALFADGHVTFVSNDVDGAVWRDYGSRSTESQFGLF